MATDESALTRQVEANRIVNSYLGWSAGAGLIPFPLVDMVLITGMQIKMVASLAALYGVPFSRQVVKSIIAGLVGGVVPGGLTRLSSSLIKSIPGVGTVIGMFAFPVFASASTYAVGKVFIQHFETGGNLLSFDAAGMREHFRQEFATGAAQASGKANENVAPAT